MLRVKLFGSGHADYNGSPVAGFPHQQSCLVLCYLLLTPFHPIHRDQLAAVFWGDYPAQTARKHLRNALWRLRQSLDAASVPPDDYLMVSDESIAFVNASPYWLDTQIFEGAITRLQDIDGENLTLEQSSELECAVELYTGDLLEGVYEDWCLYERERMGLLYLTALSKLMVYHEKYGQYERGLAYGEKVLSRDNTREKIHVQMMRLYWLMGDRQSALAQYRRCAQILREELTIQPMKETTAVYHQMLNNQFPEAVTHLNGKPAHESQSRDALPSFTEQVLARLHKLQKIIEETQSEIYQIEALLNQATVNSKNGVGG